jgi:DNA-binding NarL/FixJ family response regulator
MMQALQDHQWLSRHSDAGRLEARNSSVSHELLLRALHPLSLLQIGMPRQLFDGWRDQAVIHIGRSLEHALGLLAREEFDVIILGPELTDAWPTTAYERLAKAAESLPIVVAAGQEEPMLMVKQQQDRANDEIISSVAPGLVLEQIVLAAVLRNRAFAALPAHIS